MTNGRVLNLDAGLENSADSVVKKFLHLSSHSLSLSLSLQALLLYQKYSLYED